MGSQQLAMLAGQRGALLAHRFAVLLAYDPMIAARLRQQLRNKREAKPECSRGDPDRYPTSSTTPNLLDEF
jgi:hypothetical protein